MNKFKENVKAFILTILYKYCKKQGDKYMYFRKIPIVVTKTK